MSTISELYNKKCLYVGCSQNNLGYSFVVRRTAQRHNKRARLNVIRCERDMFIQRNMMEVNDKSILTHQLRALKELYTQTYSSVWEVASMSDTEDVYITNDAISNGDNDDSGSNSNEISEEKSEEDIIELDNNELNDPFATSDMPKNPVHRFIATFVFMFASQYVVDKGTIVLIKFINRLLTIYKQNFQLPLSLPGLQCMTDFSVITKSIKKFVVCQDCHKVYKENVSVLSHCDFVKLAEDGRYDVCIYNGAMWKELKNKDGMQFTKESPGVIYLIVNNLPCNERYKPENMLLVELMLGLKEPKDKEIKHYLRLMVDDLMRFYKGLEIPTFECPGSVYV
ncbi:hypothetical protein PHYBLDRAFT_153594 [Phycomyces blakesleeanus NRRL 1555(-)]|uniref:C2H2-type zinc finger transcription factor n=1 Tax=Phycomyces blakesleeanus (strain ATCC 8743b / DSM 1359 / FGSC 10004 / NBRC 33097 / NRRL 1555) TaxID=763407 RepID=A0A162N2Z7_PHYB8|nr:hypothetical protein PHYBLDRAFT_153594 [Phycomyces blakesleeanus NRRL 1555(-)]OAD65344.1 hypothetical protein PHYBLDRAFT_153594 [Phycomyces blakesleeanus NRRL 1555(-)]|eukprot:XP_018283384.1 hypothetical protein PHYBLDRAFT_153594 [Phycomyces blakesleeanus NRRL 1555(-)]